jgi:hypothetical protein
MSIRTFSCGHTLKVFESHRLIWTLQFSGDMAYKWVSDIMHLFLFLVPCSTIDDSLTPITVALNWQHWDAGTMMNEAMFAGSGGYMLKPLGYRGDAKIPDEKDVMPARYTVDLAIEFFAGQNIPMPSRDKKAKDFEPYVKCELHVELPEERKADANPGGAKAKDGEYKRRTKKSRGQDPDFGREMVEFRGVQGVVPELTFVRYAYSPPLIIHI